MGPPGLGDGGKREEFNENVYRMELNALGPEQLAKLAGMYLGRFVHKAENCLNESPPTA
jgi:hypothetical protein